MKVYGVIGANYGDEGKGLITDYLAQKAKEFNEKCIVILNNGGAQRGHTVINNGRRHVFHHFGSGTYAGADTYLSEFFIINPMEFMRECEELDGEINKVYINKNCLVTTPFDMLLNQFKSIEAGKQNTCGMGIWETIVRYKEKNGWRVKDFFENCGHKEKIVDYLKNIKKEVDEFVRNSNNIEVKKAWNRIDTTRLIEHWISDLEAVFRWGKVIYHPKRVLREYDVTIYENGQGLMLDYYTDIEDGTPSYTGSKGIYKSAKKLFGKDVKISFIYVSRTYLTRHGEGSFVENWSYNPDDIFGVDHIRRKKESIVQKDKTNQYNQWQGNIRYAKIENFDDIYYRCKKDFGDKEGCKWGIAVTHTNEVNIFGRENSERFCDKIWLQSNREDKVNGYGNYWWYN